MTDLVAAVIGLTDRVEAAIEAGDWPQAQHLEAERRLLLEHQKRRVLREAAVARVTREGVAAYSALGQGSATSIA